MVRIRFLDSKDGFRKLESDAMTKSIAAFSVRLLRSVIVYDESDATWPRSAKVSVH